MLVFASENARNFLLIKILSQFQIKLFLLAGGYIAFISKKLLLKIEIHLKPCEIIINFFKKKKRELTGYESIIFMVIIIFSRPMLVLQHKKNNLINISFFCKLM